MVVELYGAYSEQETTAIKDILHQELLAPNCKNAVSYNFGLLAYEIPRIFNQFLPQSVEQILRSIGSPWYLVALPISDPRINQSAVWSILPQTSTEEYLFFIALQSALNKNTFNLGLLLTGSDYQTNFTRLSESGILYERGITWETLGKPAILSKDFPIRTPLGNKSKGLIN